ncbi:MerR family transcriptional regulator [Actinophytocola oryzae]|uniref:DNA-binding transcriptional MerR regulator n=1 Tax=Actinophytocola oryzae TaxID=502181 RepID=A0A4R7UZ07_9PSEU|nr:MerR family transcriptional regulator [Actinophytocola oryzae]TDV41362.1 DNA-binding transcriptional MerR regulator [Actinophytocola oryzae]
MFTIGDFARHGRVTVRMLRHYDGIGLLRPARVDPHSGYRGYDAAQLSRLNRIVALKDLGFTLDQVAAIIDDKVGIDELRGMLRLRRAELETQLTVDRARLAAVEARLRTIETEGAMPTDDVQVKKVEPVRVAELSAVAAGFEPNAITPVIGPLYEELMNLLTAAGVSPVGPPIAYYEDAPGGGVVVHATFPVNVDAVEGTQVVDLPGFERAATIVHRGDMDNVLSTIQTLATWIDENGHTSAGYNREVYLEIMGERDTWVTELQEPLR